MQCENYRTNLSLNSSHAIQSKSVSAQNHPPPGRKTNLTSCVWPHIASMWESLVQTGKSRSTAQLPHPSRRTARRDAPTSVRRFVGQADEHLSTGPPNDVTC